MKILHCFENTRNSSFFKTLMLKCVTFGNIAPPPQKKNKTKQKNREVKYRLCDDNGPTSPQKVNAFQYKLHFIIFVKKNTTVFIVIYM